MANLHSYEIRFNGGAARGKTLTATYRKKDIRLIIGSRSATAQFTMASLKTPEDFVTFKSPIFRDAYRKVHQLHAILRDRPLHVKAIDIVIDRASTHFGEGTDHFPFMFSMLDSGKMAPRKGAAEPTFGLSDAWRSDTVIDRILSWSKTSSDGDYACCAMNAFLLSKTREWRMDRFLNLWTAMNAVYNLSAKQIDDTAETLGWRLPDGMKLLRSDDAALCSYINRAFNQSPKKDVTKDDLFSKAVAVLSRNIAQLGEDPAVVDAAYQETKSNLDNEKLGNAVPDELYAMADELSLPLHLILLFFYPYLLRCKLFHGSKALPVFSAYSDPEISDLGFVSEYLERYLNDAVPSMFAMEKIASEDEFVKVVDYLELRKAKKKK